MMKTILSMGSLTINYFIELLGVDIFDVVEIFMVDAVVVDCSC